MTKNFFSLIVLSICGTLAFSSTSSADPEPLRLGVISPLSGDFAPYGGHIKDGILLAQEQLKAKGIETQVFFEDACLPMQALSALNKLITFDKIEALVGSYCIVGMVPSAHTIEKEKLISFHTTEVPQALLDSGEYIFSTNIRIRDEAEKLAQYAIEKLGARRAATMYCSTQWGEEYTRHFSAEFKRLGGTVVLEQPIPIVAHDARTELTTVRGKKADVVLAVHVGPILGSLLKQARQLGVMQPFLSVNGAEEKSVIETGKNAAEGMTYFSPEPRVETAEGEKILSQFKLKFGHQMSPLSRYAYDATILTAQALTKCGGNKECAKSELYKTKDYAGASGVFTIQSDGGTKREFVLKTVKNGQFVRVD